MAARGPPPFSLTEDQAQAMPYAHPFDLHLSMHLSQDIRQITVHSPQLFF